MGNVEAAVVRNVDKRTSRREHRANFEAAVVRFRAAPFPAPEQIEVNKGLTAGRNVRVCVRKRPLFPHEREQHEFDMITCLPGRVVVHDARMHPDMVHMYMQHHDFAFDEAFGEAADTEEVYSGTVRDLVMSAVQAGNGTVMMYGQTGSGKTYTMRSIYQLAAKDLFESVDTREVSICFVELSGDNCFDMLNQGAQCTLNTAGDGSVHPYPCVEVTVRDPSELVALIELATKLRATAATGVHDQSSRSHAVCRIFIEGPSEEGKAPSTEGSLTLVDLAGSEHRVDSAEHNAERRKEGAKINSSLAALKDCIRATAAGAKFVAFRQNRLTQLLRGCFAGGDRHQTVIIATVSPNSKDTEHSLNTLRHACIMDGQGEGKAAQGSQISGGVMTKELLGEIDVTRIARERKARAKSEDSRLPDEWGRPGPPSHQSKKSNTAARAGLDRRCVQALPKELAQTLLEARQAFGTVKQRARLNRVVAVPYEDLQQQAASAQKKEEDVGADERTSAIMLMRLFIEQGREGCSRWRKNDLRLVSNFVVPELFGTEARIDWPHPNMGLDDLEELMKSKPDWGAKWAELDATAGPSPEPASGGQGAVVAAKRRPSATGGSASESPAALRKPPLPASAPGSGSGRRAAAAEAAQPLRRAESMGARASRSGGGGSAAPPPAGAVQRASSPVVPPSPSGSEGSGGPAPTHKDAVRARRLALEQKRQESLQKALAKNAEGPTGRSQEIAALEQQLTSGTCSGAAAAGLKKRVAALKAEALREERARAQRAREATKEQSRPPPQPPPAETARPDADDGAGTSHPDEAAPSEAFQTPSAVPSPAAAAAAGRRSPHALGAAAAPWANDWSESVAAS